MTLLIFFKNYMEKSSEKVIPTHKVAPNPFNNLMSEVQIRLNQPKSTKKIDNFALQIDSNIDRTNSNVNYFVVPQQAKDENLAGGNSKHSHHHVYVINAPLKTKNSSDTLKGQKGEKEIIRQWIVGFMSKRHLLGIHWEWNLKEKMIQNMQAAFNKIASYNVDEEKNSNIRNKNIRTLMQLTRFLQRKRKRQCFAILKEYYGDDLLFGLSNTIGEDRNNSLMLKIDSDYESQSAEQRKYNKEIKKSPEGSISSNSNKNLTKKESQSGSVSEDLSALILNHNKLKLSQEFNKSNPNIPRAKNSQKSIKTSKEIADLSLQTKKKINSQRKLSEDQPDNQLPLESNKHLAHTKKELPLVSDPINEESKVSNEKQPITVTFVLKNMNLTSLLREQREKSENQKQKVEETNIKEPQGSKVIDTDHNAINRLPFSQSFYHNFNPKNAPLVTFIKPEQQKRSTSLQVKPMPMPATIPQKPEATISSKRLVSNQYYPQDNNRQNMRLIKENIIVATQRVRPKSATPKITFTFSTSVPSFRRIELPYNQPQPQRVSIPINQQYHPQYDHQDCVLESILTPHTHYQSNPFAQQQQLHTNPMMVRPAIDIERTKQNKLQVISPSQRPQSPKRTKNMASKVGIDHKQHIKNLILPPAFNDYYTNPKPQPRNPSPTFTMKDNQVIFNDSLQKSTSTAQNSLFGCSPRESSLNCMRKQQQRMKSPKDKIFVTYTKGGY